MQIKTEVSIVIPCYNAGQYLTRSVESILFQSFKKFKIIIINDGSTDNITLKILKQLKKNPKIKIVNKKNSGLPAARNTGINLSNTKYILMLDADDWLRFDALQIFYNFLEKNKKFNYVYSNIHLADEKKGILKKNYNFFEQLFTNQIPYCIFFRTKIICF